MSQETFRPQPFELEDVYQERALDPRRREEMRASGLDPDYREWGQIRTEVGHLMVSTVKLICDHGWAPGDTQWFETMVWRPEETGRDWQDIQQRYATGEEAMAGHAAVVAELRAREAEKAT